MKFPILGIMFLIMFALKIAGVGMMATASWWLVTSPIWAPIAFLAIVFILAAVLK